MTKRDGRASASGCFRTRAELISHVWAISRQQVFRNSRAIAAACGVTTDVVNAILETEEGLDEYLLKGCSMGAPAA